MSRHSFRIVRISGIRRLRPSLRLGRRVIPAAVVDAGAGSAGLGHPQVDDDNRNGNGNAEEHGNISNPQMRHRLRYATFLQT